MKTVVFVTGHYLGSKRRAGFHFLAESFASAAWRTLFLTTGVSAVSLLRSGNRRRFPVSELRKLRRVRGNLWSYVCFAAIHPMDLRMRFLNSLTRGIMKGWANTELTSAEPFIREASLIVFESTSGLLMFRRFKALNAGARYVYRVSDDLRFLKNHPVIIETEEQIAGEFDLVSVPSAAIFSKFQTLLGEGAKLRLDRHGVQKEAFDAVTSNPYKDGPQTINVIYVGIWRMDTHFLRVASQRFPDWRFHIIGPFSDVPKLPNIVQYGEMGFSETVPYIKFADIGLNTVLHTSAGTESLTDNLKTMQYSYCKIPIVAPDFLRNGRTHVFYYQPENEESVYDALIRARSYDRREISAEDVYSWDDLAESMCQAIMLDFRA